MRTYNTSDFCSETMRSVIKQTQTVNCTVGKINNIMLPAIEITLCKTLLATSK